MISGIVYETDGTTPIQGVYVSTYDIHDILVALDTSSSSGAYSAELNEGTYLEIFQKSGYVSDTISSIQIVPDSTTDVIAMLERSLGCLYLRGDINGNGQTNGIDVTYGVGFFKGGLVPPNNCGAPVGPCPQVSPFYAAGDVNGSCVFNGIDITFFVSYLRGQEPGLLNCPSCPPVQ
jgi:hypothetical protein